MQKLLTNDTTPADVISHDVTPLEVKTDASGYARFGWALILLGVGGFGLWASLAPLDKGCLLYTSPSPRDLSTSRMPSSA